MIENLEAEMRPRKALSTLSPRGSRDVSPVGDFLPKKQKRVVLRRKGK